MTDRRTANEILDRDFLESRGKILELAASLDRLDRARGPHGDQSDPRLSQLRRALDALIKPGPARSETIQLIFSRDYDPAWRRELDVARSGSGLAER